MLCPSVPTTEEALTSRLLHSTIHTLEVFSIYLGTELGLYAGLSSGAQVTPPELARATGIAPRYAREWLEQQAVAGLLRVESVAAPADERRYWLPTEHVNVLVTQDHPAHLAPLAQMVARRRRRHRHAHRYGRDRQLRRIRGRTATDVSRIQPHGRRQSLRVTFILRRVAR